MMQVLVPGNLQKTGRRNLEIAFPDMDQAERKRLLRGSFEHSLWNLPLGFAFMVDEGKVALARGDIAFTHLTHSFSTGLTLRAGGFPQMSLMFSWGGKEGTHTSANVNTSLLGGGGRPSLF